MQEMQIWQGDPLEKEMAPHTSILAWKNSMNRGDWWAKSMGPQRVRHDWATEHIYVCMYVLICIFAYMQICTYLYMHIYFSAMHLQLLCVHTHENNDVFYFFFFFFKKRDPDPDAQFQMQRGISTIKVWVVEMLCAWMERCLCNESKNDVM